MQDIKDAMSKSIEALKAKFARIRTGRANPSILDGVRADYYGTKAPLKQLSSITVSDARTIVIDVWDKDEVENVMSAIKGADLGFNPQYDGKVIRITVPSLTEERRKELSKLAKKELEEVKIGLRNIRQKFISSVKSSDLPEDEKKREEKEIQKVLDKYNKEAEELYKKKDSEIMTV